MLAHSLAQRAGAEAVDHEQPVAPVGGGAVERGAERVERLVDARAAIGCS